MADERDKTAPTGRFGRARRREAAGASAAWSSTRRPTGRVPIRARRATAPTASRSSRAKSSSRPARHRPVRRHRQGALARARDPGRVDHQDHDGPGGDGHHHPVPLGRGRRADRRDPSVNREVTIKHADEEDDEPEASTTPKSPSRRGRRSSRSWVTSTTGRRRCSTRSASRRSSRPRPAGSRSTSAPTRSSTTAGS